MNFLKSEVKLSAVNELGCRLDDVLETANKDLYRVEGTVTGLRQAVSSIENIMKVFDRELSDGEVDLETSKTIKAYVDRARVVLMNLVTAAENNRQSHVGKIQGFQQAVAIAKKYKDEELNKLQAMKEAIERNANNESNQEESDRPARQPGERPASPIKMRRLSEETSTTEEKSEITDQEEQKVNLEESSKTKTKKQKK